MNRRDALIGSALFFLLAPGVVAGLIPIWISKWRVGDDAALGTTIPGGVLIALGLFILVTCFLRFASEGDGTPSPMLPTERLVTSGLYAHVRNPMYLAVTLILAGQALVFASADLIAYAIAIWFGFLLFVVYFEEPRLARDFPDEYVAYFANVPRWLPRLMPWKPAAPVLSAGHDAIDGA